MSIRHRGHLWSVPIVSLGYGSSRPLRPRPFRVLHPTRASGPPALPRRAVTPTRRTHPQIFLGVGDIARILKGTNNIRLARMFLESFSVLSAAWVAHPQGKSQDSQGRFTHSFIHSFYVSSAPTMCLRACKHRRLSHRPPEHLPGWGYARPWAGLLEGS